MVITALASSIISPVRCIKPRAEATRVLSYLSSSTDTPSVSLKYSELAARIFPFISIIDIANISLVVDKMWSTTLLATLGSEIDI
jgi:hypothetical protein